MAITSNVRPAARARAAALSAAAQARLAERTARLRRRERDEERSALRGLVWIALLILAGSIARAGLSRAFVPGWWRQW